jgi:hypothetical protein
MAEQKYDFDKVKTKALLLLNDCNDKDMVEIFSTVTCFGKEDAYVEYTISIKKNYEEETED